MNQSFGVFPLMLLTCMLSAAETVLAGDPSLAERELTRSAGTFDCKIAVPGGLLGTTPWYTKRTCEWKDPRSLECRENWSMTQFAGNTFGGNRHKQLGKIVFTRGSSKYNVAIDSKTTLIVDYVEGDGAGCRSRVELSEGSARQVTDCEGKITTAKTETEQIDQRTSRTTLGDGQFMLCRKRLLPQ